MSTNLKLRPGGIKPWVPGELITLTSQRRIQWLAEQGNANLLAGLFLYDLANDAPRSGFLGDGCIVTVVAGLNISIAAGVGWYDDTTNTDDFKKDYTPIVVPIDDTSLSCQAREGNPRIDVVSLAPDTDSDNVESVNTFVGGVPGSTSTAQREFPFYSATITKGTAAAVPVAPATPSGHIKIAEIDVPATAGAIVPRDCRPILQIGDKIAPPPPREYHTNWIPGSSTELLVTQSATPSMILRVAGGEADIYGQRIRYAAQTVTIGAAEATEDREDLVLAYADGSIGVFAGTPSAPPASIPATPVGTAQLAHVYVAAVVTSLANAVIYDYRIRYPVDGDDHIVPGSITGAKLSVVPVMAVMTASGDVSNVNTITGRFKDIDGNNVLRIVRFACELIDMQAQPVNSAGYSMEVTTGTRVLATHNTHSGTTTTSTNGWILESNSNGQFVVAVTDVTTGANRGIYGRMTPLGTAGYPQIVEVDFN